MPDGADLDLLFATDVEVHRLARAALAAIVTKDIDFGQLLERFGPPPQVVWVTTGNTPNASLGRTVRHAVENHWLRSEEPHNGWLTIPTGGCGQSEPIGVRLPAVMPGPLTP